MCFWLGIYQKLLGIDSESDVKIGYGIICSDMQYAAV